MAPWTSLILVRRVECGREAFNCWLFSTTSGSLQLGGRSIATGKIEQRATFSGVRVLLA